MLLLFRPTDRPRRPGARRQAPQSQRAITKIWPVCVSRRSRTSRSYAADLIGARQLGELNALGPTDWSCWPAG